MYRFILKRLLMLIPVLLGVSFIVYTILSFTPGDPVQMMLGDNYSEESYAAMQEELGLDDPFLVQYGRFIINAVHGDFGTSYSTGNPVAAEIAARLPNTILLSACAMLFAILIGIPLGVISATHQYSAVDNISMVGALVRRLHAELLAGADADDPVFSEAGPSCLPSEPVLSGILSFLP